MKIDSSRMTGLLLEGLMVLLGVSIALIADEWREERQLNVEAEAARVSLEEEILVNYEMLLDFHVDVTDRHRRLRAQGPSIDGELAFEHFTRCFVGYRFTQFRRAAWSRASRDRIGSRLPNAFMDDAGGVYAWNDTIEGLGEQVSGLLYSPMYFDPASAEIAFRLAERILWQQQRWATVMISEYQSFAETAAPHLTDQMEGLDAEVAEHWVGLLQERAERISAHSGQPVCAAPED